MGVAKDELEPEQVETPTTSLSFSFLRNSRHSESGSSADGGSTTHAASAISGRKVNVDFRSFISERTRSAITQRYDIDKKAIGSGGFGKVYIATDRHFGDRQVAIKQVLKINEERVASFTKEIQIMKDLDHPSICKIFETYDEDRFMFFVIEYCAGGDLFDRFQDCGGFPEAATAEIIRQIAAALKYAHGRGIAHRDMKLENVCFCSTDPACTTIKVIDWGMGKFFCQGKMVSTVGTHCYAAPEVMSDNSGTEGYTTAVDIWSLGVVAYVTICGKPPFWGGHNQMLNKMRAEEFPMHSQTWSTVSAEGKDFIRRILKWNPADRLTIEQVLTHPWMTVSCSRVDSLTIARVLSNLEQFSHAPDFFSMCVASVARQLDYSSLGGIHEVFCFLDVKNDGVLDLSELQSAFEKVFGVESPEFQEVENMFARLDFDGTNRITYTEFCAAGLGERSYTQEHILWAAFKTFDRRDDGRISKEELQEVLQGADINQAWSSDVCEEVARNVMQDFAGQDGTITFHEWLNLMRASATLVQRSAPRKMSKTEIEITQRGPTTVSAADLMDSESSSKLLFSQNSSPCARTTGCGPHEKTSEDVQRGTCGCIAGVGKLSGKCIVQ